MRTRCTNVKIMTLLNPEGQHRLEVSYGRRVRNRSSFIDHVDAYLRALQDEGRLERYMIPGVDPFMVLADASEKGSV